MVTMWSFGLAGAMMLLLGTGVALGDEPSGSGRCTARKFEATARSVVGRYRCEIEARKGNLEFCLAGITDVGLRLAEAVAKADAVGPCPGTAYGLQSDAYTECIPYLNDVVSCDIARLEAAKRKAAGKLRCLARAARQDGQPDPACLADKEERFVRAFARIAERCPCPTCAENVESIIDRCVGLIAVVLSCGNGAIDPGEQCDGQSFCVSSHCQIEFDPRCCQFAAGTDPICVATAPALELCGNFGGTVVPGYCPDNPCPGDPFPGCQVGACEDPPIPPTTACCQQSAGCQEISTMSTLALRAAMVACVSGGGRNVIGGCGNDGQCVPD